MKLILGAHGFKPQTEIDLNTSPCPSVVATGLGSYKYWVVNNRSEKMLELKDKPPYHVSGMNEISSISWNGYKVVSTFSGCGGSCLGYRMAGYKVIWANEFVPAAQESYRANAESDCYLDCRDIRQVAVADILQATGLQKDELDLLDGSPPCQAFSTAGKRERGWGKDRQYEHGIRQKNETLFDEYIRLVRELQPKVFVAENVSGLVKGVAKGFFIEILNGLKACGYNVRAKLLDAQWLGVPQMRQRIIFIGVRQDLNLEPVFPKPLSYRYCVREALPWIDKVRQSEVFDEPDRITNNRPCPSITVLGLGAKRYGSVIVEPIKGIERRKFTIAELKRICAFPDDFVLTGSYAQQWARLGNSVPPVMMYYIAREIKEKILDKIQLG